MLLLGACLATGWVAVPLPRRQHPFLRSRCTMAAGEEENPDLGSDGELSRSFAQELSTREQNSELYRSLSQRPEYEDKEMYNGLRKRVDVNDDALMSSLEANKDRLKGSAQEPDPNSTPNEVVELVLMALRERKDASGVELLMKFSGPGCSIGQGTIISAQDLREYFTQTQYSILLDWVSKHYPKKLELSMDKRKAWQQIRLKSREGDWVPVSFQLTKYEKEAGEVWLIQQVMVKSEVRGITADDVED